MKTWNRFNSRQPVLTALTKRLLSAWVIVAVCLGLPNIIHAQQTTNFYTVTTPSLSWNDISGTGTTLYDYDVWRYYNGALTTSLPFTFKYDGTTISSGTTIYIDNARISLGTDISGNYGWTDGGLATTSSFRNVLFPWGVPYCQVGDAARNTGYSQIFGIYEEVTGSPGSRVYTIQMNGVHTAWGSLWSGPSCISSMQVKLYEADGKIQFLYQTHGNYMGGSYTAGIGINGASTYNRVITGTWYTPSSDLQFAPPIPPGEFSLQPKSLNYGGVNTGQSMTLTTTLRSLGPSPVKITNTFISGSNDYVVLNPIANGTSIAPGSSYDFQIRFTPTNTGSRSASFTVNTDAADSATQVVFLNGTGVAPNVQFTFLPYKGIQYPYNTLFHHVALHFGDSLNETIYVQNTGLAPLQFNSISFVGLQAGMYSIAHFPPNPLPAGATDSITVRFSPYFEGRPDAQLVINTNAFNTPLDTVTLWGTGKLGHLVVTPLEGKIATGTSNGTLLFDSVAIGDSLCKTLALHNTGTDTLIITKQIVTYGDYDFHFYPITKPDTILPPDASRLVNVCFVPISAGSRLASIRFYTNIPRTYPDQNDTSQALVQVMGTGVPFGKLSVAGTTSYAAIVGTTKCFFDTLRNTGSADITINSVKIGGSNAADFTLSGVTPPLILVAGGKQVVQICYAPTQRGLSSATLDVVATSSGRAMNQSLPLTGVGQQVCMDATPNPVGFGSKQYSSVTLAKSGNDTTCITVKNCGDVPMSFKALLSQSTSADYALTMDSTSMLAPNATGTICIAYSPDTLGASSGSVIITSSESSLGAMTLPLNGSGAGVIVAPSGQPATTVIGSCDTFSVTLANNGNVAWVPGTATITGSGAYSVVGVVTPDSIAPGQSGSIKIAFCPTASGQATAMLDFTGAAPMPLGTGVPYQLNGTAATSGVATRTEQDGFSIGATYPNPTANSASVIVTTPRDAKVTVSLVRVDGAAVATVFDGSLTQGQHVLSADAKDLPSGTYFYMLESGNVRLVREMVVTH